MYLLGDKYVLKVFDSNAQEAITNEIELLSKMNSLKIAKIIERFSIDSQEALVYEQIQGKSLTEPSKDEIIQIGTFLKEFHLLTTNSTNNNPILYGQEQLKNFIEQTDYKPLLEHFENITCKLQGDGIIHGDLFVDNAKFINGNLSGVFDFCDACVGDFLLDLAVIALSWCYEAELLNYHKVEALLQSYKSTLSVEEFKPYMHYALLYYTTSRYIHQRDYQQLLYRLENLY